MNVLKWSMNELKPLLGQLSGHSASYKSILLREIREVEYGQTA